MDLLLITMFKWFLKIMGLKANNIKVKGKDVASLKGGATSPSKRKKTSQPALILNEIETKILLEALKNATFKGEMVEAVYTLAVKLKNNLDNV